MKTLSKILVILIVSTTFACNSNTKTETVALNNTKATVSPDPTPTSKQYIKVALLLDTSNSMDGLIDQAKAQLWDIVNELSYAKCGTHRPELQIALYEYGNDGLSEGKGYVRQVLNFSEDLDEISKQLFSLTTNGGEEYCGTVIQTSLNDLQWGKNADDLKLIFIAGNESFTQGKINYTDATTNANEKDVTVNTIFCGRYNDGIRGQWKNGADLTKGKYIAIDHNQSTVHVASPYDDQILNLNTKLNSTYVAYGSHGVSKMEMQAEQDVNAESYSKANAVKRSVSKSSRLYKNTSWDLVDAIEENEEAIETLKEDELPNELKGKTKSQIKTYIANKKAERDSIKQQIQELNTKRKDYVLKQQNKTKNGLENAMIDAIKTQAQEKNYKWEK